MTVIPANWYTFAERIAEFAPFMVDVDLPPEAPPPVFQDVSWVPEVREGHVAFSSWKEPSGVFKDARTRIKRYGPATIRKKVVDLADGLKQAEVSITNRTLGQVTAIGFFTFSPKGSVADPRLIPHKVRVQDAEGHKGTLDWSDRHRQSEYLYLRGGSTGRRVSPGDTLEVIGDPTPYAEAMAVQHAVNDYMACMGGEYPERCAEPPHAVAGDLWPPTPRARDGVYSADELRTLVNYAEIELPEVKEILKIALGWGIYFIGPHRISWERVVRDHISVIGDNLVYTLTGRWRANQTGTSVMHLATPAFLRRWRTQVEPLHVGDVVLRTLAGEIQQVQKNYAFYLRLLRAKSAEDAARIYARDYQKDGTIASDLWQEVLKGHGLPITNQRRDLAFVRPREPSLLAYEITSPADVARRRDQIRREEEATQADERKRKEVGHRALEYIVMHLDGLTPRSIRRRHGKDASIVVSSKMSGKAYSARIHLPLPDGVPTPSFGGPEVRRKEDAIPALFAFLNATYYHHGGEAPMDLLHKIQRQFDRGRG